MDHSNRISRPNFALSHQDTIQSRRDLEGCEDLDRLEAFAFSAPGRADSEWIADCILYVALGAKNAFDRLRACVVLKEIGHPETAYHVLAPVMTAGEADESTSVEFIKICRRLLRDERADSELERLIVGNEYQEVVAQELIFRAYFDRGLREDLRSRFLTSLRQWRDLRQLAEGVPAHIETFLTFAEYAEPRVPAAILFYEERRFANPFEVHRALDQAINRKTPFAFVRLGDGEGSVMTRSCNRMLFGEHRSFFLKRWFGDPDIASNGAFDVFVDRLRAALVETDIIGVPERSWMRHEIANRNIRAFMSCFNILDGLREVLNTKPVTNTSMNIDLAYRFLLTDLMRKADRIVLVTSHKALSDRLCRAIDLSEIHVIIIPPAHSDLSETGYTLEQSHYRDEFDRVCAELDAKVQVGTLVMVGAGFLGKWYCLVAKRAGGIAVDIGSVADLWMGFRTRPLFDELGHLSLE